VKAPGITLSSFLARYGQNVIVRRQVGNDAQQATDATVRAVVRGYEPQELAGGIQQGDSRVIISPVDLAAAHWPGGQPVGSPPSPLDAIVPRAGDRVVIAGRSRAIVMSAPIYVDGELVRIDMQVRG
jgi:hypothetical protein